MLSPSYRLANRRLIKQVHKHGQMIRGHGLNVKALRKPAATTSRFAIVISTKVEKSAVRRNRLRRRIRGAIAQMKSQLTPGFDVIVIATDSSLSSQSPAELNRQLQPAFKRLGITP